MGKFERVLQSLRLKPSVKQHVAWHHLFINLMPEEVITLVQKAGKSGTGSIFSFIWYIKKRIISGQEDIQVKQEDCVAWNHLFNKSSDCSEIEKIISENWMYPGIKATVINGRIVNIVVSLEKMTSSRRYTVINNVLMSPDVKIIPKKGGILQIS